MMATRMTTAAAPHAIVAFRPAGRTTGSRVGTSARARALTTGAAVRTRAVMAPVTALRRSGTVPAAVRSRASSDGVGGFRGGAVLLGRAAVGGRVDGGSGAGCAAGQRRRASRRREHRRRVLRAGNGWPRNLVELLARRRRPAFPLVPWSAAASRSANASLICLRARVRRGAARPGSAPADRRRAPSRGRRSPAACALARAPPRVARCGGAQALRDRRAAASRRRQRR